MGEEPIKKILKDVGLTEKESAMYIFLAKHKASKGSEITKQTRIDKAEVYRILKKLQSKGLLEATLESPTRFVTVPFEKVIDGFVKARRDEAALVEKNKQDLLEDWRKISRTGTDLAVEKFVTLEGAGKIYPKIYQMVRDARSQILTVTSSSDLLRIFEYGLLDCAAKWQPKSALLFRFLVETTDKNGKTIRKLLEEGTKTGFEIKGRSPDLGLQLSPRMVLKDNEEVIFFTTNPPPKLGRDTDDAALWTNCRAIVQAFAREFNDMWSNSTDIYKKIAEIEGDGSTPQLYFTFNPEKVKAKYEMALPNAMSVSVLTSSQGLVELCQNSQSLRQIVRRKGSIKVMAPIIDKNQKSAQELSEFCDVRHVSESNITTILVDNSHLFQFKNPNYPNKRATELPSFESSSYTNDFEHAQKARLVLDSIWKGAHAVSKVKIEPMPTQKPLVNPIPEVFNESSNSSMILRLEERIEGTMTEQDVIKKIINAQKIIAKNPLTDMNVQYGSTARGQIRPPSHLNLPDMKIEAFHCNKQSSWGAEDCITVYLWLETPKGSTYVPVAHVTDNPKSVKFRSGVYAGTPAGNNVIRTLKDRLQLRVQGNTLFAGWTIPIPLLPPQYVLPPCCILFEGYGRVKTAKTKTSLPSGKTQVHEFNSFPAFVTFFHPSSKYSGPGTEGSFCREHIMTAYPPDSSKH